MITSQTTAAQRRAMLANAHARYFNSRRSGDDAVALAKAFKEANCMGQGDLVVDVQMDNTTIVVTIDTDDNFRETVELDAYGNTLRGVGA